MNPQSDRRSRSGRHGSVSDHSRDADLDPELRIKLESGPERDLMSVSVDEVLSLWRGLERVRDQLPDEAVERERVLVEIAAVRAVYGRLEADPNATARTLRECQETIDRAFAALA